MKTRSVPARPRSTRSSASFPRPTAIRSTARPLDADLEILLAKLNTAKRENVVLGVGSQELLKNAARVFMSPTKHLVIPSPTYGDPAGFAQNVLKYTVQVGAGRREDAEDGSRRAAAARQGRRAGLHLQPEQPDRDDQQRAGDQGLHRRGEEDLADHRDPDRRGVLRLRQRPGLPDRDSGRARDARRARGADLLEGLRHGRRAHRLRDWRRRHREEDGRLQDAVQREHVRRRRGGRLAQGSAAHQGRERPATRRCATSP